MLYQQYREAIFKIWEIIKQEDFRIEIEAPSDYEEYTSCGLCNPEFNAFIGRDKKMPCPLDFRAEKDIDEKPCMDSCQIFARGNSPHKIQIIMSKFMSKFMTAEGQASLKSLAKACRGQKGVSKDAAKDFISVAEKVKMSTERFGGYNFSIVNGGIQAERRND